MDVSFFRIGETASIQEMPNPNRIKQFPAPVAAKTSPSGVDGLGHLDTALPNARHSATTGTSTPIRSASAFSYHPSNFSGAWSGPLGSAGMRAFFSNTVTAALTALVVNVCAGTTAAYFATRLSPRQRTWYLRLFLLGTVVPFVLLLTPYYRAPQAIATPRSGTP